MLRRKSAFEWLFLATSGCFSPPSIVHYCVPTRLLSTTVILAGFLLTAAVTVVVYRTTTDISSPFPPVTTFSGEDSSPAGRPVVYIGVVSRYPPPVIYQGYQPIMDYLNTGSRFRFELRLGRSYQETVEQLIRGDVAAAFLGTYIYVRAHEGYGVRCILMPLNENGEPYSRSVLITVAGSPIRGIADLRGKRVALPSQDSFSGNWLPLSEFPRHGLVGEMRPVFKYFSHHQSVVYQVLRGAFDAGVVKERVAREFLDRKLRIVLSSDPIPGSPLVVRGDADTAVINELRTVLLRLDVRRPDDRALVSQWDQEFQYGFAEASDAEYDGIRRLLHVGGRPSR
jgi:phosphonate transport system substrate-binding protein